MLIPKFSIRQLFFLMFAIGIVSACLAGAARGNLIAFGLAVGILATTLPFVAYAVVHWVAFATALLIKTINGEQSLVNTQTVAGPEAPEGHADA